MGPCPPELNSDPPGLSLADVYYAALPISTCDSMPYEVLQVVEAAANLDFKGKLAVVAGRRGVVLSYPNPYPQQAP